MLDYVDYSFFIGLGILIGLPFALTFLSEDKFNMTVILVYMTIINAFLVNTSIMPLWTQVMFLVALVGIAILEIKTENKGGI